MQLPGVKLPVPGQVGKSAFSACNPSSPADMFGACAGLSPVEIVAGQNKALSIVEAGLYTDRLLFVLQFAVVVQ